MDDTIAAISTALGEGAISIVRLSGEDAISIAMKVYKGKNLFEVPSHTIHYGHIVDGEEIIDEVMVTVMRAPKTFTREDVIEINCHGGIATINKILELLLTSGARLAEPGEFTKRAFLNGRIDLSQAEAICDLIVAKTDIARSLAVNQLAGKVSNKIKELRNKILDIIAHIEVNIDYPEYDDVIEMTNKILMPKTKKLIKEIKEILIKALDGKIIKEGIKTVIIGRPNVGKSSLLNRLLDEEKAIVTNIAGTTRDTVEGLINLGGITLNIIDTAGIRETKDTVEKIGVEKSLKLLDEADLVLIILEKTKDKNNIVVINKIDLEGKIDRSKLKNRRIVELSALKNEGIEILEKEIKNIFNLGKIQAKNLTYISNARHISLLKQAEDSLKEALLAMEREEPIDMVEIDLKNAWHLLGEILGEEVHEELINELFSRFCLGK
jgi:tRNA modification GTPase